MVRGKVSPVVHVMVNGVEVRVDRDGTFSRMFSVSESDNGGKEATVCAFDLKGDETCWSKNL